MAEGDVADFVEEEGAAVGEFEAAGAVGFGIGERAAHMAEELALENAFGEAAHVDRDEGLAGAEGDGVQGLGNETFAGAVFAGDEDVGIGGTDARDDLEHGAHGGGLREEVGAGLAAAAEQFVFLLETAVGADGAAELELVADDGEQAGIVPGLGDEIAGAAAHGLDGDVDAGPRRHDDDRQRGVEPLQFLQKFEAFLAAGGVARVVEVHEDERVVVGLDGLDDGGGRFDGFGGEALAFEQEPQGLEYVGLIVGDEDAGGRSLGHGGNDERVGTGVKGRCRRACAAAVVLAGEAQAGSGS